MKKPLMMGVFCLVIMAMSVFAGCIDFQTEANTVDGRMYNYTWKQVHVYFKNRNTGDSHTLGLIANDSRAMNLKVGRWDLDAYYTATDKLIDSAEMVVEASDTEITVIVYNTSLYAESL